MSLPNVQYRCELERVAGQLGSLAALVDIRGDGAGQFIYAHNGERALEISRCDEGIWVQFWRGSDESPSHEITVSSYDKAIDASIEWLATKS